MKFSLKMAKPRNLLFRFCSLLMASIFAFSASVQFDDPDWYLWFPLYAAACVVNLVKGVSTYKKMAKMAKLALLLGLFLVIKVLIEDFMKGLAGFWSLDMRERVVREKFGSGLVIISMFLQLQVSSSSIPHNPTRGNKVKVAKYIELGMAVMVGMSCGLSFIFLVFQKREMKF